MSNGRREDERLRFEVPGEEGWIPCSAFVTDTPMEEIEYNEPIVEPEETPVDHADPAPSDQLPDEPTQTLENGAAEETAVSVPE